MQRYSRTHKVIKMLSFSEIGAVADFISVSQKTAIHLPYQKNRSAVTVYIPALFRVKQFLSSQEELE